MNEGNFNNPIEGGNEEVEKQIRILEESVSGMQEDVDKAGGEAAIQKRLEEDDVLYTQWTDRANKVKFAFLTVGSFLMSSVAGVAYGTSDIFNKLNFDIQDDKELGKNLIGVGIVGILGIITGIVGFIKSHKRVSKSKEILETRHPNN